MGENVKESENNVREVRPSTQVLLFLHFQGMVMLSRWEVSEEWMRGL